MTYRHDVTQLARALAELLTTGPYAPTAPAAGQVHASLVCRDTVAGALRDLTGALLQHTPPPVRALPDLLLRSPAHALHAALTGLSPASPPDLPLTAALSARGDAPLPAWQRAARAAAALESYHQAAATLPGPAAWSLARDLAALSATLPLLDTDLAAVTDLPAVADLAAAGRAARQTRASSSPEALLDEHAHGLLAHAAGQLAVHTTDVPFAQAALASRPSGQLTPVTRLGDLPAAGRQLVELLRGRGSQLTVTEARAALRAVTYGVDLTARTLAAARPAQAPGEPPAGHATGQLDSHGQAIEQLLRSLPDLQHLLHSQLATLTPPAPPVLFLSSQIQSRLAAAGRLHDHLQASGADPAAHAALAHALAQWAVTTAPVVQAVHDGLRNAALEQALLTPRQDSSARHPTLLWLPPTSDDTTAATALQAAGQAAAALHAAAVPLATLLPPTATGAVPGPPDAARRAAADASAAFGQLTTALRSRAASRHTNPARTAHPTVPADARHQPPPRRR